MPPRNGESIVIINSPMLDYATITSYAPDINNAILADIFQDISTACPVKVTGYEGIMKTSTRGSVIIAQGLNNAGKRGQSFKHWLAKFSGEVASDSVRYYPTIENRARCSRLDVQVTLQDDRVGVLGMLETRMRTGRKFSKGKGRPAEIKFWRSDTGESLYRGGRESAKFWRMYEKFDTSGNKYIRWEFQVSGGLANWLMGEITLGNMTVGGAFLYLTDDVDESFYDYTRPFTDLCGEGRGEGRFVKEMTKSTMEWLESLTSTVQKMLNSHDTNGRMKELLDKWDGLAWGGLPSGL